MDKVFDFAECVIAVVLMFGGVLMFLFTVDPIYLLLPAILIAGRSE